MVAELTEVSLYIQMNNLGQQIPIPNCVQTKSLKKIIVIKMVCSLVLRKCTKYLGYNQTNLADANGVVFLSKNTCRLKIGWNYLKKNIILQSILFGIKKLPTNYACF